MISPFWLLVTFWLGVLVGLSEAKRKRHKGGSNTMIWKAILDNRFNCQVERVDDYTGRLTVEDGGTILLDKPVSLAYGAKFGPDVMDVRAWENEVITAVDNYTVDKGEKSA